MYHAINYLRSFTALDIYLDHMTVWSQHVDINYYKIGTISSQLIGKN